MKAGRLKPRGNPGFVWVIAASVIGMVTSGLSSHIYQWEYMTAMGALIVACSVGWLYSIDRHGVAPAKDHPEDLQHHCHKCGAGKFRMFVTQPDPQLYLECVRCGQHLHPDSE